MMYIKWFLSALLMIPIMVFCYLTNWFVVLFADDVGELPWIFKLWQTWDSSLDNRTYVTEDCPAFLRYDFDKYYMTSLVNIGYGRQKKVVTALEPFPKSLYLKRYLNRAFWLYRNCGYGFAFYLFGVDTDPKTIRRKGNHFAVCSTAFRYKNDDPVNAHWKWCIYLGWKFDSYDPCRAMIATRFTIHRR